jgi:hypothetical protein
MRHKDNELNAESTRGSEEVDWQYLPSDDTKGFKVRANQTLTVAISVWAPPNRLGRPYTIEN